VSESQPATPFELLALDDDEDEETAPPAVEGEAEGEDDEEDALSDLTIDPEAFLQTNH